MNKIKSSKYWKYLCSIAISISLQNLLIASLGAVDQVMLGKLGTKYVAGVGIGFKISNLFIITMTAIGTSTGIMVSQYFGVKDRCGMIKSLKGNALFSLFILVIFLFTTAIFSKELIGLFTKDEIVIPIAVNYMKLVLVAFLPITIKALLSAYLRSIQSVKIVVISSIISIINNTALNYILIFGHFGTPKLTYIGAAIATVLSVYLECIILIVAFIKEEKNLTINCRQTYKINKAFLNIIKAILFPLVINEFLWGLGETIYSLIYSRMGIIEMAAIIRHMKK